MALIISDSCIACYACQNHCPSSAIRVENNRFSILPHRCNECEPSFNQPQCAAICPVETAILNQNHIPLNPIGSLTPDQTILLKIKGVNYETGL